MAITKADSSTKKGRKHKIIIATVLILILLITFAITVFATPGSDYNKERYITINLNGGSASMKWIFQYDRDPPNSSRKAGVFYDGVATGKVYDRYGNVHTLGLKRYEVKRDPPLDKYPFYDNENPKNGKFKQHMDFVGQTPWVWISNPTRTGYTFTGWTISPSRTTKSHNNGTAIHAGLSGGDFTITANWKDDIAPSGSFSPNSRGWGNSNVSVTISGSDSGSGVKRIRYRTETNGSWGSWSGWTSGSSRTVTLSSNGSYRLQAEIEDNAGNTKTITSGYYRIDKTQPSVSFSPNSRDWGNSNVSVSISMSDSGGSGFKQHRYRTETNGSWGSWSSWSTSSSRSISFSSNGSYRIQVEAQDNAGNTRSATSGYFRIDKTGPTVSVTPDQQTSWGNSNIPITIKVSDSGGSSLYRWRVRYETNGSWGSWSSYQTSTSYNETLTTEGNRRVQVEAYDNAGNKTTYTSGYYRIDKTAPSVSANTSSRDWGNSDVSVTLTYSDSGGSGVKQKQYAWSTSTSTPSSWSNYSSAVKQSSNGTWYLHAKVTDNAGNSKTTYFGPYRIDKTAPTTPTITVSPTTWTNGTVTVTIKAGTDSGGSGVSKTEYRINGGSWKTYSSAFSITDQGTHKIEARTVDKAGNTSPIASATAYIDKTAPTITANPSSRSWDDKPVTVTLNYSDSGGSGLKEKLYAWSQSTQTPASNEWKTYSTAVTQESPGTWYLHAKATDNAGNQRVSYFGPYVIDGLRYIEVIPSSVTIVKTETLPLTVKAIYHHKTEEVTTQSQYTSNNTSIVTVNEQGIITGKAVGQAIITATYNGKQAQCTVSVEEPEKIVSANLTITKDPTYVFTKWNKMENGQPSRMNINISWNNLNVLVLRADKTVLRSEPIIVNRAESQHRINRYTTPETFSWGTLINSNLTGVTSGSGSYYAEYEYDKAGKPNSPFTFIGYYMHEGEEKSFTVTVNIPVNALSTSLIVPLNAENLSSGFEPAYTNSADSNTWEYSGVWPASGVLTLTGSRGECKWPVPDSSIISSFFGRRIHPVDGVVREHYGIDIPAPEGTNIVSPDDGKVVYTGYDSDFGNMLVVRSGQYDFVFGHCSDIVVTTGQDVSKGQVIAKVGSTGTSTGPHLDFRVAVGPYTQKNYIDPLSVVKPE